MVERTNILSAITLQDINGENREGTKKYVGDGYPIDMMATSMTLSYKNLWDTRPQPNRKIDPTTAFSARKSDVVYAGFENPVIQIQGILDMSASLHGMGVSTVYDSGTGTGSAGTFVTTKSWTVNQWSGYTLVASNGSFPILTNTATTLTVNGTPATGAFSIRLGFKGISFKYLWDLVNCPNTLYLKDNWTTSTGTPLSQLIGADDVFGNEIYDGRGMPVLITNLTGLNRTVDKETVIDFKMELTEDK